MMQKNQKSQQFHTMTHLLTLENSVDLQFRVSAISLTNIVDADIKTLQKETESK